MKSKTLTKRQRINIYKYANTYQIERVLHLCTKLRTAVGKVYPDKYKYNTCSDPYNTKDEDYVYIEFLTYEPIHTGSVWFKDNSKFDLMIRKEILFRLSKGLSCVKTFKKKYPQYY